MSDTKEIIHVKQCKLYKDHEGPCHLGWRTDFQAGLESNFPICCILWHSIRVWFGRHAKILIFPLVGGIGWKPQYQHILCPIHLALPDPVYRICAKCDWLEIDIGETTCRNCFTNKYYQDNVERTEKRKLIEP